jgi:hypothetical protein
MFSCPRAHSCSIGRAHENAAVSEISRLAVTWAVCRGNALFSGRVCFVFRLHRSHERVSRSLPVGNFYSACNPIPLLGFHRVYYPSLFRIPRHHPIYDPAEDVDATVTRFARAQTKPGRMNILPDCEDVQTALVFAAKSEIAIQE